MHPSSCHAVSRTVISICSSCISHVTLSYPTAGKNREPGLWRLALLWEHDVKFQCNPTVALCLHSHTVLGQRVARIASILAARNPALTGTADSQSSALSRKLALLSEIMAERKHSSSLPQLYHQKGFSFGSLSSQTECVFPGMFGSKLAGRVSLSAQHGLGWVYSKASQCCMWQRHLTRAHQLPGTGK